MVQLMKGEKVGAELIEWGGSLVFKFTTPFQEAIGVDNKNTEIVVMLEQGKHGPYLAIWKR